MFQKQSGNTRKKKSYGRCSLIRILGLQVLPGSVNKIRNQTSFTETTKVEEAIVISDSIKERKDHAQANDQTNKKVNVTDAMYIAK